MATSWATNALSADTGSLYRYHETGQETFTRNAETAQKVAHTGLKALAAGKSYVVSGLRNYLGAHGERLVPRRFVTRTAARMFKPATKE